MRLTIVITMVTVQNGTTALYRASQEGHSTVVQLLVEAGASLDVQADVCNLHTCVSVYWLQPSHTCRIVCPSTGVHV